MRTLILMSALGLTLAPAKDLATKYEPGIGRQVTIESAIHIQMTGETDRGGEKSTISGSTDVNWTTQYQTFTVAPDGVDRWFIL